MHSMLFDVVQERQAQAETLVSPRLKQVEGDVDNLKCGLKALTDDANGRLGKLQQFALDSVLDADGYANALKQWTGKSTARVVYDSNVCPFTDECLFQKVKGKPNIAIVAFTTDGDVFGGFYSVAVTEQNKCFKDPEMFIFSFESHGRCATPQRFLPKGSAGVWFYAYNWHGWFVRFDGGIGNFFLGNEMSKTFCVGLAWSFEGLKDMTLSGKGNFENFTCCRLVAIQLE